MSIRRVEQIDDLVKIKNVVISVSDKSGLDQLIHDLIKIIPGVNIYSTGETYKKITEILGENSFKNLSDVKSYTDMPPTEGGLVKTLHHKLFLGYLTETYSQAHQDDLRRENAEPIDLVVCNLYPFSQVISNKSGKDPVHFEDARGNIDIGGPSMVRAAAKNFLRVGVVVNPADYPFLIDKLKQTKGHTNLKFRLYCAQQAFIHTAQYDSLIANYFITRTVKDISFAYPTILNKLGE